MVITKTRTIVASILFILIFPVLYMSFADRVLDVLLPPIFSNFNWFILPGFIALMFPYLIYKLDTVNDHRTKIINCCISFAFMLLGVALSVGIYGFAFYTIMQQLP